ncbi:MAG: F0F1 ATP synthase subunit delta [Blastocatellia bacterium]
MKTVKQTRREAKRLFRACLVNGFLDELRVRQVVQRLLQSNRRGRYALVSHFLRFVKLDRALHTARIETTTSLPADLLASVVTDINRLYGPGINTSFSLNPDLIGGMRIRVASDLYDRSVKAALAELQKRF